MVIGPDTWSEVGMVAGSRQEEISESLTISFSSLGVCPRLCQLCEIYWVVDFYCLYYMHLYYSEEVIFKKTIKKIAMILLLVDMSYAWIIKVVDIFKRETDVFMTSRELPLVLVS